MVRFQRVVRTRHFTGVGRTDILCTILYTECTMSVLAEKERSFLEAVSRLAFCNPFLPERTKYERLALGDSFVEGEPVWSMPVDNPDRPRANAWRVIDRLDPMIRV